MFNLIISHMADVVISCLSPCLGTRSGLPTENSTDDNKHVDSVRAKLGKPVKQPRNIVLEMVGNPTLAFDGSAPVRSASRTVPVKGVAATPLTPGELGELFDKIDKTLSGPAIPYVIGGLGAMLMHGFRGRGASTVSIIVPAVSKDVIRPWVLTGGGKWSASGFEIQMDDSTTRAVKVRYISDSSFEGLGIVSSTLGGRGAKVLALTSCLEQIASAFVKECNGQEAPVASKQVETIIRDIRWTLQHAVSSSIKFDLGCLDVFLSPGFWDPFYHYLGDGMIQEIMILCTNANLPIGGALEQAARLGKVLLVR